MNLVQGFARQTVRGNREVYNKVLGKYLKEETQNARLSVEIPTSWLTRKSNQKVTEMFYLSKTRNVSLLIYGAIFHETHTQDTFFSYQKQTKTTNCERHENDFFFEKCINCKSRVKKRNTQIEIIQTRGSSECFEHNGWMGVLSESRVTILPFDATSNYMIRCSGIRRLRKKPHLFRSTSRYCLDETEKTEGTWIKSFNKKKISNNSKLIKFIKFNGQSKFGLFSSFCLLKEIPFENCAAPLRKSVP